MPTCTPVYRLPYAIGSDPPCDIGETLCAFATAVETELDRLDEVVDRVADTIPMAKVRLTVPFSFDNGIGANQTIALPFDTVDVDTADMVDLAANRFLIQLPRLGRYVTSFQIVVSSVIPTGDTISGTFGRASDQYISDTSVPAYLNGAADLRYSTTLAPDTTTGTLSLDFSFTSAGVMTVSSATALVYWIGDLT